MPSRLGEQLRSAAVIVELHAEPEVWAEIEPVVDAMSLRANSLVRAPVADEARARLREIGAHDPKEMDRLRARMLAAMRADLQH